MWKMGLGSKKVKSTDHFTRQEVQLADGESVYLDWWPANHDILPASTPVIIMVPGLTSDSRAHCVNIFTEYAWRDYGFRTCVFIRRGYGLVPFKKEDPDPITWNKFSDLD